jgi:hypothetical protein
MIFDRTLTDVQNAIKIRDSKIKRGLSLTEQETQVLERGFLGIETLNRIEQTQAGLKEELGGMGYYNAPIYNKSWYQNGVFFASDLQRLVTNTKELQDAAPKKKYTTDPPVAKYHFEEINKLEKTLYDIQVVVNDVQEHYKFCGEFNCGGEM